MLTARRKSLMFNLASLPQQPGKINRVLWKVLPTRPSVSGIAAGFNLHLPSWTFQLTCQPPTANLLPDYWCVSHLVARFLWWELDSLWIWLSGGISTLFSISWPQACLPAWESSSSCPPPPPPQPLLHPSPNLGFQISSQGHGPPSIWQVTMDTTERQTKRVGKGYNLKGVSYLQTGRK